MLSSVHPQYDAICAFQVLEHVPAPRRFLSTLISCLRPSGLLIVGVPNADGYLRLQCNILNMPPHHMTHWSSRSLRSLVNLYPLQLVTLQTEPLASYHIDDFLATYAAILARFGQAGKGLAWSHLLRPCLSALLRLGFRRAVRGHTICAIYRKIGPDS